jgi:hypothetical protein
VRDPHSLLRHPRLAEAFDDAFALSEIDGVVALGAEWRDYEFWYKPGDVARRPRWNIPHQPRLDWQMWFAALDDPRYLPWFSRFLERLLENEPTVTALLEKNPFPDKPPIYLRAQFYDYAYANSEDKAEGRWWNRRLLGLYFPAVRLKGE